MVLLGVQSCVGCVRILDDLRPFYSRLSVSEASPSWIAAEVYYEKYGFRFTDLHVIEDACPSCARAFEIDRPSI